MVLTRGTKINRAVASAIGTLVVLNMAIAIVLTLALVRMGEYREIHRYGETLARATADLATIPLLANANADIAALARTIQKREEVVTVAIYNASAHSWRSPEGVSTAVGTNAGPDDLGFSLFVAEVNNPGGSATIGRVEIQLDRGAFRTAWVAYQPLLLVMLLAMTLLNMGIGVWLHIRLQRIDRRLHAESRLRDFRLWLHERLGTLLFRLRGRDSRERSRHEFVVVINISNRLYIRKGVLPLVETDIQNALEALLKHRSGTLSDRAEVGPTAIFSVPDARFIADSVVLSCWLLRQLIGSIISPEVDVDWRIGIEKHRQDEKLESCLQRAISYSSVAGTHNIGMSSAVANLCDQRNIKLKDAVFPFALPGLVVEEIDENLAKKLQSDLERLVQETMKKSPMSHSERHPAEEDMNQT